ncbi:MAG TPA: adenylate/guanylate cyclase domain-containing protein, partial [Myxococcaceae bacterium]|nr:adenylate/guanylate cyclase domain-containing protein [Myxococcaceae bacterium]
VTVYELLGRRGELGPEKREVIGLYAEALGLWRAGRFAEAARVAGRAVAIDPGDGPSRALEARSRAHALAPPMGFDGVVNLDK